jgi:hypothetical protein
MPNSGVLPKRPSTTPVSGMSVRALERADLPAVAAFVRETFRLGPRRTEPALPDFLARTLIEQSWADPEIPSPVASDEAEEALTPGTARDPRLLAAIEQPDALVSRLDRDPWIDTYVDGSA